MKLEIEGKIYEIEYSFAAATCDDCINELYNYIGGTIDGALRQQSGAVFKTMAGTPNLVIALFYAGLLEHNPVENKGAAAKLLKQYFADNKGKENANFGGMFKAIMQQLEDDAFLDLIGLSGATEEISKAMQEKKLSKKPTDHLSKATQK